MNNAATETSTLHDLVATGRRHHAKREILRRLRHFGGRVPTAVWASAAAAGLVLALAPSGPGRRMLGRLRPGNPS